MRISRKMVAVALAGATLPATLANFSGTATAFSWTSYRVQAGSGGGSEPGIDIGFDKDGNELIYVHTTNGIPQHNRAFISQPSLPGYTGLQMFKEITFSSPYNRLPGGGDADIAYRGDDLWFIDLWAGSNSIQYSPDKGKTWTVGTPFTTLPLSDRQWIALGDTVVDPQTGARKTTVYVTYQFIQPGMGTWIARSRDNGLTWDHHAPIQAPGAVGLGTIGIPAHIVSDGSKTVAVAMNAGGRFVVAVSRDEGETWEMNPVSSSPDATGSLNGLTMNPEDPNELAVVYPTSRFPSGKNVVRISRDGGRTWSEAIRPVPLDPNDPDSGFGGQFDFVDVFPWIDWRGDKIALAWYQSSTKVAQMRPDNAIASNQWHVWYSESTDDGATFSIPQQVTTVRAKAGPICTRGLSCDADRELGDFMQLAIDAAGKSWIVMVHVGTGPVGAGVYAYRQG